MIVIDWQSVESCIEDMGEVYALEQWAKQYHENLGRDLKILEIGSYCGRSTALLAQFGHVIAIDLWGDPFNGLAHYDTVGAETYEKFRSNMVRLGLLGTRVFPIIATSKVLDMIPPVGFDVIFIDACHQYEETKRDLARSVKHIVKDGILIVDDYKRAPVGGIWSPVDIRKHGGEPWEGVQVAVDEFLKENRFEITGTARGRIRIEKGLK